MALYCNAFHPRRRSQVLHGKAAAWQGFARRSNAMEKQRVATELLS
uniref:Uncharacterized protein n=1 Tax=Ackermannviridae sp. TaxID=2831612 RepID=A0A8S5RU07_9CAUD|nr:MAG TPA: hypothetical protein [Ackermannviridae sp.]